MKTTIKTTADLADLIRMIDWYMRMGLITDRYFCQMYSENMI